MTDVTGVPFSAAVKERPVSRVKDLPASGQQVELWWRKRRLWCREVLSPRRAFIQTSAAVKPRARTTERPRDKIASAIAGSNRPVSDVAAEYQVSWTTGASGVDQRGGEVVAGAGADIAAGDR
jgi:transposase